MAVQMCYCDLISTIRRFTFNRAFHLAREKLKDSLLSVEGRKKTESVNYLIVLPAMELSSDSMKGVALISTLIANL